MKYDVGLPRYTLPVLGLQWKLQCATHIQSFELPSLFIFKNTSVFYYTLLASPTSLCFNSFINIYVKGMRPLPFQH